MLAEPEDTPYDLKFHIGDVPVRVNPWFWAVSVLMVVRRDMPTMWVVAWVAVSFISILIHELGHAYTARYFGWRPRVVLYSFGGLAIFRPTRNNPPAQLAVALAGPGAGFLLAIATFLFIAALGWGPFVAWGKPDVPAASLFNLGPLGIWVTGRTDNFLLLMFIVYMFQVNIYWGLINLLPVFPLDGGQATRHILQHQRNPEADVLTFQISIATGAAAAIWGVYTEQYFLAGLFGFLAFNNWTFLQQSRFGRWDI